MSTARSALQDPELLRYVARPLLTFEGDLPEHWSEGTYRVKLRLFGRVPLGHQFIVISFPEYPNGFALRDIGHGRLINTWDHLITVEPASGGTRYRDDVTVRAGALTLLVWLFAQVFYSHRQRRLRRLFGASSLG